MDKVNVDVITNRSKDKESIIIRNAYKRYAINEVVLNGLNLTVPTGTIYALLGPSGCGKTTLLNCIVGLSTLDAGSIQMGVKKRSEIGYMPQFLSLHEPMTLYENFFFYGYLFGMKSEEIKSRANVLISFLELPSGNSILKFLSGGEKRRVSIAIAFIHSPKILILDEPTVGLDPLLCQKIWDMMLDLIKEGKSIIITTHYIQEAQQAHTIGLMRGGVLLAEENPTQLMDKYDCTDLEETFLKLSKQQENRSKDQDLNYPECKKPVKTFYEEDNEKFSSTKHLAIMYKNLVFFRREVAFIIFVIFLPTIQAYIFNLVVGVKPTHLKLGIINEEIEYSKCNFAAYDGCFLDSRQNVSLSCLFLEYLRNKTYDFKVYSDSETALHDVRENEMWALLHFRNNYTRSLAEMITNGRQLDEETFINGFVSSWIDLSNQYIGTFIKYDITRSVMSLLEQSFINCGLNGRIGSIAISFETPVFGTYDENFITYASAAMLCLCCFFSSSTSTAMIIVTEKEDGIMERMLVTGASMTEMILSLVVLQSIGQMISIPIVMLTMYWIFNNPLYGSVVTLLILLGLTGFTGVLYGTTLAVLNKDLKTTAYIGVGVNIVLCLTTGLLWPVEAQHHVLKNFTWMLPLTWIADAARGITAKSYSFSHPLVLRGFASAVAWNIIFTSVIYFALKRQKERSTKTESK